MLKHCSYEGLDVDKGLVVVPLELQFVKMCRH